MKRWYWYWGRVCIVSYRIVEDLDSFPEDILDRFLRVGMGSLVSSRIVGGPLFLIPSFLADIPPIFL